MAKRCILHLTTESACTLMTSERGDNLKIIYVISPTFLKSLYKEALHYDFKLQGYGNVTNALKGLLKTNIDDILGFAYVNTRLPSNTQPLEFFIKTCGMLSECYDRPKKFLFALQDTTGLEDIFSQDFGNLEFSFLPDTDVYTDLEINRGIFGSILKYNYDPYRSIVVGKQSESKLKNVEDGSMTKSDLVKLLDDFNRLEYIQPINPYFLNVFESFHMMDSLKRTIEDDEIYQDYEEYNKLYATLRRVHLSIQYVQNDLNNKAALAKMNYRIKDSAPLDKSLPSLELYENLLDSLNDTLEKTSNNLPELDASSYTLAKSIIFILKKELLKVHDLIYTGRSE